MPSFNLFQIRLLVIYHIEAAHILSTIEPGIEESEHKVVQEMLLNLSHQSQTVRSDLAHYIPELFITRVYIITAKSLSRFQHYSYR